MGVEKLLPYIGHRFSGCRRGSTSCPRVTVTGVCGVEFVGEFHCPVCGGLEYGHLALSEESLCCGVCTPACSDAAMLRRVDDACEGAQELVGVVGRGPRRSEGEDDVLLLGGKYNRTTSVPHLLFVLLIWIHPPFAGGFGHEVLCESPHHHVDEHPRCARVVSEDYVTDTIGVMWWVIRFTVLPAALLDHR